MTTAAAPRTPGVDPVDERLPAGPTLALALQHLLAAYASLVVTPLILAGAMGLDAETLTLLISASLVTSGLCTLLQCLGAGASIGIRLPVIQGTTIAAVPALVLIGTTAGLNAMFGATLVAGFAALLLAGGWSQVLRLFPPVVTGTVISAIGLSLIPVAVMWMSGGAGIGAQDVATTDLLLSFLSLGVVIATMRFGRDLLLRGAAQALPPYTAGALVAWGARLRSGPRAEDNVGLCWDADDAAAAADLAAWLKAWREDPRLPSRARGQGAG